MRRPLGGGPGAEATERWRRDDGGSDAAAAPVLPLRCSCHAITRPDLPGRVDDQGRNRRDSRAFPLPSQRNDPPAEVTGTRADEPMGEEGHAGSGTGTRAGGVLSGRARGPLRYPTLLASVRVGRAAALARRAGTSVYVRAEGNSWPRAADPTSNVSGGCLYSARSPGPDRAEVLGSWSTGSTDHVPLPTVSGSGSPHVRPSFRRRDEARCRSPRAHVTGRSFPERTRSTRRILSGDGRSDLPGDRAIRSASGPATCWSSLLTTGRVERFRVGSWIAAYTDHVGVWSPGRDLYRHARSAPAPPQFSCSAMSRFPRSAGPRSADRTTPGRAY